MKRAVIIFLMLLNQVFMAQINVGLVNHLQSLGLTTEEKFYISTLKARGITPVDSILYIEQLSEVKRKNDSLFFKRPYNSLNHLYNDTIALFNANMLALNSKNTSQTHTWFNFLDTNKLFGVNKQLAITYLEISSSKKIDINKYPEQLHQSIYQINKINKKSPTLAAIFSALIPGSGKLYGMRPNAAVVTLFSNLVYGAQAAESIKHFGFKNAYSIFSVSFFGVFYLSNIYNSYTELKLMKKYKKQQAVKDAFNYYSINYDTYLYQ